MNPERNVWIVCGYGGLPAEGQRDYRCYLLAKELVARGCRVTWWTSAFDHISKTHRSTEKAASPIDGFEIRLVPAPGYRGNVSLGRIRSEWAFGRAWRRLAADAGRPDTIVLAEPARFYGDAVAAVAREKGARLVLDIMDLWPELFEMLLPGPLRWAGRVALWPLYRQRARLVRGADALVAVTQDYLDTVTRPTGVAHPSAVVLLGRHRSVAGEDAVPADVRRAATRGRDGQILAVYAGTLGDNYDVATLCDAARRARASGVRWIVAGAGPSAGRVRAAAADLGPDHFAFLGLQPAAAIAWLLDRCDIGLCCYREGSTVSMPLKAFDYLAAGLPIVTSLDRELGRLVDCEGIGVRYAAGDPASLVQAVTGLAEDAGRRRAAAAAARAVGARLDADAQYAAYADFLLRVSVQSPHGPR